MTTRTRDIALMLSKTAAANTSNLALINTSSGVDSSEILTLIAANSSSLDSAKVITLITANSSDLDSSLTTQLIDSNYIAFRIGGPFVDSAYVEANSLDSERTTSLIDSAYVQLRSGGGGGGGGGLGDYGVVNSTGTAASAIGTDAIAIGEGAHAYQTREISIGNSAGRENQGCWYGVNIGYYAGRHMIGNYGICIGNLAGGSTTNYGPKSGENNIAIGHKAMTGFNSGSGYGNIAIGSTNGSGIMYNLSSGYNNVVTGSSSGSSITTGWGNVVIGAEAGSFITTGHRNTIVGRYSGQNVNTGFFNVLIGSSNIASASGVSRNIVIGNALTGKGADTAFIGGTSGAYNGANSSSWSTTSDERIKTNITGYTTGLAVLDQVNVKTYNYLSDSDIATAHPELADSAGLVHEGLDTEKTIVGVMAQELESLLPNTVTTRDNGIKTVNKDELFWVMLNSIKELKARVEALEDA